jgi:DNA-binding transcriptional ArsR family regulator
MSDLGICQVYQINAEAVAAAKKDMEPAPALEVLARTYQALGEHNRLKILLALRAHELCVCDLCEVLEMTAPAVSHHLRRLRDLGLVRSRRAGKLVYYSLDDEHISDLLDIGLTHVRHRFNL